MRILLGIHVGTGLCFAIVFMALLIIPQDCLAASLSVTKAVMEYSNVLHGGYAEDTVYVSSDTDFDVPLTYETLGDVAGWISFEPDINLTNATLYVSSSRIQPLKIIIQPPADAAVGNYTGAVRIITGTLNRPEGPYGSYLQAAFLIRIRVEVTGTQTLQCNFGGLSIPDAEIGRPVAYSLSVSNSGNVRVRPNSSIDIWNQDQTRLIATRVSSLGDIDVLPTTTRSLDGQIEDDFRIGQYWAYATVYPCGNTQLVSFSILEKGAIADNGELLRIENKPWASTGEIVPISAIFKNNGQRVVSSKLKGAVILNGKIVRTIDTDFIDVAPGEIANITDFFTPKKLGQYQITGRVLYNNKLTFEKSAILNVNQGEEISDFNMLYVLVVIVIAVVILILLIKIKRRKQRMARI